MQNKKTIIVFQEINGKTIKKTFEFEEIRYFQTYIVIKQKNGKEQGIRDFKNYIIDVDSFGDLEK